MHKLIFGGTARHKNGNRLDCTRSNLIESRRNPGSKKRKLPDGWATVRLEGGRIVEVAPMCYCSEKSDPRESSSNSPAIETQVDPPSAS